MYISGRPLPSFGRLFIADVYVSLCSWSVCVLQIRVGEPSDTWPPLPAVPDQVAHWYHLVLAERPCNDSVPLGLWQRIKPAPFPQ